MVLTYEDNHYGGVYEDIDESCNGRPQYYSSISRKYLHHYYHTTWKLTNNKCSGGGWGNGGEENTPTGSWYLTSDRLNPFEAYCDGM